LHLRDPHVVEEIPGEGCRMIRYLDQPRQDGIGIDLKDAGYGTNAQALSQRAHRPHQKVDRHTLAMQRGAMGLLEIAITARAMQLPPGAPTGMPCTIREERRVQLSVE
jgi:hypothetical protein